MIRKMTEDDISQVSYIEQCNFSLPWKEKDFLEGISHPNNIFLVDECDGKVRGYLGMYIAVDEGEITSIAVESSSRRQGVAQTLLLHAAKLAREQEIVSIFLEVRCSNESAIALYESVGFERIGVRKGFYDFPKEDGYIYQMKVG